MTPPLRQNSKTLRVVANNSRRIHIVHPKVSILLAHHLTKVTVQAGNQRPSPVNQIAMQELN
jgi:hypothetical protein